MKKQLRFTLSLCALVFCISLLLGNMTVLAAEEHIVVQGLEDITLSKIEYTDRNAGTCPGFTHAWALESTIQEPACGVQGIWRIKCTVCGITATTFSDIYYHEYVNGVCIHCGDTTIEIAPDTELAKWEYELEEADKAIALKRYISDVPDVVVYGAYRVDGSVYSTVLNGSTNINEFPDFGSIDKKSIIINKGVTSTNCINLFRGIGTCETLDVSNLDTSRVTDMTQMFASCRVPNLDLSNLDTSNLTNMRSMFKDCWIETVNMSNFDTSSVNNMYGMFSGCYYLPALDLSSFDTGNVTNMASMFSSCYSLSDLRLSSFETGNVTNMCGMFSGCSSLTSLDVSSFDTSRVTDMSYMFRECTALTALDLSSFQTYNVESMKGMFMNCPNLTAIYADR